MKRVIIHADDYAISRHVSEDIEAQIKNGSIQSVSVMPNMTTTREGIKLLSPYAERLLVSVHLNLVEGKCVSEPSAIPGLADQNGYLKLSWLGIMVRSVSKDFRKQAGTEFRAQIRQVSRLLKEAGFKGSLRLDSHQHVHMIPGLFGEVCRLTKEFDIEYIRLTREPILPFFRAGKLWKTYSPINIAKNILLNLFAVPDRKLLKRLGLNYNYFFGLILTGRMDYERTIRLLPLMPENHDLELVLHAGRMLEPEITDEYNKKDFVREHISSNRILELRTVERLKERRAALTNDNFLAEKR